MRTLIAIAAGSAVLCGCEPADEPKPVSPSDAVVADNGCTGDWGTALSSVEYCGHKYVIARVYRGVGICHAGDCGCRAQVGQARDKGERSDR